MNATEVIEQIEQLPLAEQKKVFSHLIDKRGVFSEADAGQVSPEFKRIVDEVFVQNAELFRKLAQ